MKWLKLTAVMAAFAVGVGAANMAGAKLPAPTEEQKKAAEEKKAKEAEAAKKAAEALAKAQDRVAEKYLKEQHGKAKPAMAAADPAKPAEPAKK